MNFDSIVDSLKNDIIQGTQQIIKIKSVEEPALPGKPFGEGVNNALEYALNLAKELGFTTKNLDGYAGYAEYGEGTQTLGILVHLDIVPEGDGWTYPPYSAEIHQGKIYGRGAIDNKGPAIAALYALKALMNSKVALKRKVRIIFGTNEETNWGCMKHYLEKEPSPDLAFVPDSDFPLINGEKGVTNVTFKFQFTTYHETAIRVEKIVGGNRSNIFPDYCQANISVEANIINQIKKVLENFKEDKGYQLRWEESSNLLIIKSYGISAHGSLPEKGKNAVSQLMGFLGLLELGESPAGKLVAFYNQYIGMEYNGQSMGIGMADELSGKLTFNVGIIKFQENQAEVVANIRVPIKYKIEEVVRKLEEVTKDLGITILTGKAMNSYYIPEDDFLVQKLLQVYQAKTGDYQAKPKTIGGATYARTLPKAVPFGPLFPGTIETAHEKDEHISIEDLLKSTKIYAQAIYELTR